MIIAPAYWIWLSKLTEVLHVHFAFLGINNSSIAVQFNINSS